MVMVILVRDGGGYKQLGDGLLTIESGCSESVDVWLMLLLWLLKGDSFEFEIERTVLCGDAKTVGSNGFKNRVISAIAEYLPGRYCRRRRACDSFERVNSSKNMSSIIFEIAGSSFETFVLGQNVERNIAVGPV